MATPENPDTPHSDTARVAEALHNTRQRLGRPGDTASDWQQAEKIVQSPLRTALFKLNQPLLRLRPPARRAITFVGQDIPRWIFVSLPQVEMVKLVALPLILAGATSIITRQLQWEANQTATLDSYFDHLEKLTFTQGLLDDEPKNGAIVLARGRTIATLRKLDLERKKQLMAFLQASDLVQVELDIDEKENISFVEGNEPVISFEEANLQGIDLRGVSMMHTDLRIADLEKANLAGTMFVVANLTGANLTGANLEGAYLGLANLESVGLRNANLKGANLQRNNLKLAMMEGANLKGAVLLEVNLEGAEGVSQEQLSQAILCQVILPSHITLDPNRDCESIGWAE